MPAGTITLTNNSTAVTGAGTAFNTELKANDFIVAIVGGTTYTLGVSAVGSATALTLTTAYGGPTTSGLAWTPIPNGTLVGITAQIAADTARAIRALNFDKMNWQQVYSASGNITVNLQDGSTFTGPSWKYLADNMATKVGGAVPVAQGGTGATTAASARTNLGLGSSAVIDTGTSGNLIPLMSGSNTWSGAQTCTNSFNLRQNYPSLQMTSVSADGAVVGKTVLFANETDGSRTFYLRRFGDGSSAANQVVVYFPTSTGTIALQGTSGREFKKGITPADPQEALKRITSLNMTNYIYTDDEQERIRFGFIAEEAELIAPQYIKHIKEAVDDLYDDEGVFVGHKYRDRPTIDNNPIVMDLIGAIQALQKEICAMQRK